MSEIDHERLTNERDRLLGELTYTQVRRDEAIAERDDLRHRYAGLTLRVDRVEEFVPRPCTDELREALDLLHAETDAGFIECECEAARDEAVAALASLIGLVERAQLLVRIAITHSDGLDGSVAGRYTNDAQREVEHARAIVAKHSGKESHAHTRA